MVRTEYRKKHQVKILIRVEIGNDFRASEVVLDLFEQLVVRRQAYSKMLVDLRERNMEISAYSISRSFVYEIVRNSLCIPVAVPLF